MGLIYIKEVEGNSILGIWEIDDAIESMANDLSIPPESSALKTLKRKTEYIATRLLLDAMYAGAEIQYHQSGEPFLLNDVAYISISHSKNLVAILLNRLNRVGVDVQFMAPKITRLKEKFLNAAELSQIPSETEADALHIYWCAKEALFKLGGVENVDFKTHLNIDTFSIGISGKIKGQMLINNSKVFVHLCYERMDQYFLVYTID